MSATTQRVDIDTAAEHRADYIQTREGMYGHDMPLWIDGFSWAARLDTFFARPTRGQQAAAVTDDSIIARGVVTELVVDAEEGGLVMHAQPPER